MRPPQQLLDLIRAQAVPELPPGIQALAAAARERHGEAVRAVLFYGSSLRNGNLHDGLADLYLLVDGYRPAFENPFLAVLNHLLPPNVFYLEVPFEGHLLRAKYAVLTLADFQKGTERWFHSYLWGRFCQKCALVWARDDAATRQVHLALAAAVMTFVARALPRLEPVFTARDLWARGLSLSYRAELRTEQPDGAARLFDADPDYYQALTAAALQDSSFAVTVRADVFPQLYQVQFSPWARRLSRLSWGARMLLGKLLSVLRLLKGLLTFRGGVDYILWKIERHSGARVEVSPGLRRFPPLAVLVVFWRLYRRGAFR